MINCGHHPASQAHMTYDQYRHSVSRLFGEIEKYLNATSKTKLFWLENTAPPLREVLVYWFPVSESVFVENPHSNS